MKYTRNSTHYHALRALLTSKRRESGMTVHMIADKLGVSHSIIGRIEDGTRKLEISEFIEYCKALEVDPHEGLSLLLESLEKKSFK